MKKTPEETKNLEESRDSSIIPSETEDARHRLSRRKFVGALVVGTGATAVASYDVHGYTTTAAQTGARAAPTYLVYKQAGAVLAKSADGTIVAEGEAEYHDRLVLQECIDLIAGDEIAGEVGQNARRNAQGTIIIQNDLTIDKTINMRNLFGLEIVGLGYQEGAVNLTFNFTDSAYYLGIDLTNSRFVHFKNLRLHANSTSTIEALIFLSRDTSGTPKDQGHSVGNCKFSNCVIRGATGTALVYNYGSEVNHFLDCYFNASADTSAVVLTETNIYDLGYGVATGKQSMLCNYFTGCTFLNENTSSILFEGGGNHVIDKCFFGDSIERSSYALKLAQKTGSVAVRGIWVRDSRFECRVITSAVPIGSGIGLQSFTFDSCGVDADKTEPFIDLDHSDGELEVVVENFLFLPNSHFYYIGYDPRYKMAFRRLRSSQLWLRHYVNDIHLEVSNKISNTLIEVSDEDSLTFHGLVESCTIRQSGGGGIYPEPTPTLDAVKLIGRSGAPSTTDNSAIVYLYDNGGVQELRVRFARNNTDVLISSSS